MCTSCATTTAKYWFWHHVNESNWFYHQVCWVGCCACWNHATAAVIIIIIITAHDVNGLSQWRRLTWRTETRSFWIFCTLYSVTYKDSCSLWCEHLEVMLALQQHKVPIRQSAFCAVRRVFLLLFKDSKRSVCPGVLTSGGTPLNTSCC